jgi:hypothetical protein
MVVGCGEGKVKAGEGRVARSPTCSYCIIFDDQSTFVFVDTGILYLIIYTIRQKLGSSASRSLSFTSLHLPFTTFNYHSACYTKGEGVKAKNAKLYMGVILPSLFNFVVKRIKFVT